MQTMDMIAHPLPAPLGRLAWGLLGLVAAAIGVVGFVFPLIPGLPFLMLAALCFANVSTRVHARLARMPAMRGVMGHWTRAREQSVGVQLGTAASLTAMGVIEVLRMGGATLHRMLRRR